jgi:hypothetical protein
MRLLILLLLASCSSKTIIPRTSLTMGQTDSYLYSNGSTHPNNSLTSVEDSIYEVEYKVIIKNTSQESRSVDLKGSSVSINDEKSPIPCFFKGNKKQNETLPSSGLSEIQCIFKVFATAGNQLKYKDTIAKIEIGLNSSKIDFGYHFRIEDFKNAQKTSVNSGADRANAK